MRQLKISHSITNRDSQSLEKYLQEIGKIDLLTPEEEVDLAKKVKAGDQEALERLTKANLRFVVSVAKQYQHQGLALSDLINEGNLGLIEAAKRFNETRGFKFISYAVWWIRQSIFYALALQVRVVKLPLNKIGILTKTNRVLQYLEQSLEREPNLEEIVEYYQNFYKKVITEEEIEEVIKNADNQKSLNDFVNDDTNPTTLGETIEDTNERPPDEKLILLESLKIDLATSLHKLKPRETNVIKMFFGIEQSHPMSLDEIGEIMDLSKERVRQIKDKALSILRKPTNRKFLQRHL
jgi:RNA polymerase primary sigma factor